jgi:hypothetical protein
MLLPVTHAARRALVFPGTLISKQTAQSLIIQKAGLFKRLGHSMEKE